MNLFALFFSAMLINNIVLTKFLGMCPFMGVSTKLESALGMGAAVIFVIFGASLLSYALYYLVLVPLDLKYMQLITFILLIAAFVQFVELFVKKYAPALYKQLGIYLPLITTNCAVLGVTVNNINDGYNFVEALVSSLGCGLGFLLAMVLFAGVRGHMEKCNPPEAFKGLPLTLVAASIVSLAFFGFAGVIDNLFA